MAKEEEIIRYLFLISDGKIDISMLQAKQIVNIVTGIHDKLDTAYVQLYKIDAQTQAKTLLRIIKTTDEVVRDEIIKALEITPNKQFYFYNCFDSEKQLQGCIYSANPNLFDSVKPTKNN